MRGSFSILLTGVEGFIGKSFKAFFQSDKRFQVFSPTKSELDLREHGQVKNYIDRIKPGYILHLATSEAIDKKYEDTVCEDNLRMFFNLHRVCKPETKLFNFTSGSDFSRGAWREGMEEEYFDSDVPRDPHSYSKYTITKYIRAVDSPNLVNLRLFGVFGALEDYRFKFISNTIAKTLVGLPIIINQNACFHYLYIKDLFNIVISLLDADLKYNEFNICPCESIELLEIAKIVGKLAHKEMDVKILTPGMGTVYTGNNNRLVSQIPEICFSSYQDSIKETYYDFETRKVKIEKKELEDDIFLKYVKAQRAD